MNYDLHTSLINQAEQAFLRLIDQINVLLESSEVYTGRNPVYSDIDRMKDTELKSAVSELGTLSKMLASEIARWKRGEDRVLSRVGIEQNLLNELYANMESMLWFFNRETIDTPGFSLDIMRAAYSELVRCNRLL